MMLLYPALLLGSLLSLVLGPNVNIYVPDVNDLAQQSLDWLNEEINRSECKGRRVLLCYHGELDPQQKDGHDFKPSRRFQRKPTNLALAKCCQNSQEPSDAHWHALKLNGEEMGKSEEHSKFKEYNNSITSGAFLDDYFGVWALKMDISGKGKMVAKCANGQMWSINSTKTTTTLPGTTTKGKPVHCPNGSHVIGGCSETLTKECFDAIKQREKEVFVPVECAPEYTWCFEASWYSGADSYHKTKGCALPDDTICKQYQRMGWLCKYYHHAQPTNTLRCWSGTVRRSANVRLGHLNETFAEIECGWGPEHAQCFYTSCISHPDDCLEIRGCAPPAGNKICEKIQRKECPRMDHSDCNYCKGNLCNHQRQC